MKTKLLLLCAAGIGIVSCSLLAPVDRRHPADARAFLKEYDSRKLGVLKLRTMINWLRDNPRETFKEMRAERPVITTNGIPTGSEPEFTSTVVVALRKDVIEVLGNWEVFSVRIYGTKMDDAMGPFMLGRDHSIYNLVEKPYMRRLMPPSDFPRIKTLVTGHCADAIKEGTTIVTDPQTGRSVGRIEVVNGVGRKVPIRLTGSYGGFPGPDEASMFRWSRATQADFFKNTKGDRKVHADAVKAGQELSVYIPQLIKEKRARLIQSPDSEDTILARMLKEGTARVKSITDDRTVILTAGLLIGAGETTEAAVVKSLDELLRRPEQLQGAILAAKNNDDALLAKYVWEALRFVPGNSALPRYAEQDYVLAKGTSHETKIAKGSIILAGTLSAMFDSTFVKNPEEFRLDRPDDVYFLFGYGHHRCLGDYVSMIQVPQIVKSLLRLKNIRRAPGKDGEIDTKGGPFPESFHVEYDLN